MKKAEFITIPQLAKILGLSRIAVYKQVKAGKIKARKAGKMYLIPYSTVQGLIGRRLTESRKKKITKAVKRTVAEYGEVLKMLGRE